MTPAQLSTLKADIIAKQGTVLAAFFVNPLNINWDGVAGFYNTIGAFIVWRTNVTRREIYDNPSVEGTTWSWTFYKNQSVQEQGAWKEMFMALACVAFTTDAAVKMASMPLRMLS